MRMSAVTLAACIRMLNNTVMADDGTDPQQRLEIQRNIQTLSTPDVIQQIDDFGAKRLKKRLHNGGLFKKTRLYTRISEYTVQLR